MKEKRLHWWSAGFTVLLVFFMLVAPGEAKEPLVLDIRCFGSPYWIPSRDDTMARSFTWEWFNMGSERRGARPAGLGEALPLAAIAFWNTEQYRSRGEKPIFFLEYYRLDEFSSGGQVLLKRGFFRVIDDSYPFFGVPRERWEGVSQGRQDKVWAVASPTLNQLMENYLRRYCISGSPVSDGNSYLTAREAYGYGSTVAGPAASQGILYRAGIAIASAISHVTSVIKMSFGKQ